MSQPAPTPKQSIIQTLLIASVLFLGFQLFFGMGDRGGDSRPAEEIYEELLLNNARLQDATIVGTQRAYNRAISDLEGEEKTEAEVRAAVVVAYTQFQAGRYKDEYNRVNTAFLTLQPKHERLKNDEVWDMPVEVVDVSQYGTLRESWTGDGLPTAEATITISASQLYEEMKVDLSGRMERHMVLGFLPGYQIIDFLVNLTGAQPGFSYAFAAFLLAVLVRAIVWPLYHKQFMGGRQMSQLSPYIKELKAKYEDKNGKVPPEKAQKFQQDTMKLYQEYGINPFAACLPALLMMPLFLVVYQFMLHYRFEFANGVFLWINPEATSLLGIPIAPNLGERDYILILIYAISMVVTSLLMPVSDPTQVKQQRLLGVGMAVMFSIFMFFYVVPSAFVLYWTFTNLLGTAQALISYKVYPAPPLVKVDPGTAPKGPFGAMLPVDPADKPGSNGAQPGNGKPSSAMLGKTGAPKKSKKKRRK